MSNWRQITEADLAATLSQGEIDAFRRDGATDGSDPVASLLARTAGKVRVYISSNASVKMGAYPTIPEGLVSPACDLAAWDVLKRIDVVPNEARKAARDAAEKMLEDIARGLLKPESAVDDDGNETATTPAFAPATPERMLD